MSQMTPESSYETITSNEQRTKRGTKKSRLGSAEFEEFRFARNSVFEPPPLFSTSDQAIFTDNIRRSFGIGYAGPLVGLTLLSEEPEEVIEETTGEVIIMKRKKKIGLLGCILVVIGCVLGAGIFAAPQEILKLTESSGLTLIVWFSYGVMALIGALCYAELACTFPVPGGDYAYLYECFGPLPAFLFQWSTNLVIIPSVIALMGTIISTNLINPYFSHCADDVEIHWAKTMVAICFIMFFSYINCVSSTLTAKLQGWLMVINVTTITFLATCGIAHMVKYGRIENQELFNVKFPEPKDENVNEIKFKIVRLVSSIYQASLSYFGYNYVTYITEDLEHPLRDLPLGICISIPVIIFINVFVNFCYMGAVPFADLNATHTVAKEMMESIVSDYDIRPFVIWIGPTLVAVAVLGGLTSFLMTCSRVSYTGARNGHFPRMFTLSQVHNGTPLVSIIFSGILGCSFLLLGQIALLIQILTYLASSLNCLCVYGLVYMRYKKPNLTRPIKMPIVLPVTYVVVSTVLFFVPIVTIDSTNLMETLPSVIIASFIYISGVPTYFLFVKSSTRLKWRSLKNMQAKLLMLCQKLWIMIPEIEDFDD